MNNQETRPHHYHFLVYTGKNNLHDLKEPKGLYIQRYLDPTLAEKHQCLSLFFKAGSSEARYKETLSPLYRIEVLGWCSNPHILFERCKNIPYDVGDSTGNEAFELWISEILKQLNSEELWCRNVGSEL